MTISFIIPVYNGERYISACLYSLLKQTYTDWQAILINDGSTDNSLSVLQSFAKSDSRFVVYSQNNQGVAIARNRGIKEAQGEYISFLDIDDTLVSDFLERFICHFEVVGVPGRIVKRNNVKVPTSDSESDGSSGSDYGGHHAFEAGEYAADQPAAGAGAGSASAA